MDISLDIIQQDIQECISSITKAKEDISYLPMQDEVLFNCIGSLLTTQSILEFTEITVTQTITAYEEDLPSQPEITIMTESAMIKEIDILKEHADFIYSYLIKEDSRVVNDVWIAIKSAIYTLSFILVFITGLKDEILERELYSVV